MSADGAAPPCFGLNPITLVIAIIVDGFLGRPQVSAAMLDGCVERTPRWAEIPRNSLRVRKQAKTDQKAKKKQAHLHAYIRAHTCVLLRICSYVDRCFFNVDGCFCVLAGTRWYINHKKLDKLLYHMPLNSHVTEDGLNAAQHAAYHKHLLQTQHPDLAWIYLLYDNHWLFCMAALLTAACD